MNVYYTLLMLVGPSLAGLAFVSYGFDIVARFKPSRGPYTPLNIAVHVQLELAPYLIRTIVG